MLKKRRWALFMMLLGSSILIACNPKAFPVGKTPLATTPTEIAKVSKNRSENLNVPTVTPFGPSFYFWPTWVPDDFVLSPVNSFVDGNGFVLEYKKPYAGMSIKGGPPATEYWDLFHQDGKPITVRDREGYYFGTGAGFSIQWEENGNPYFVGGPGVSLEKAVKVVERLETVDLATFQRRLEPETRYKAVYLVQGQGVLSQDDLNAHPEVLVVHSLEDFRQHTQAKVALWIDKNAVDFFRGQFLCDQICKYWPVVLVGYSDPVFSFHDVFFLDSMFEGPPASLTNATKDPNLVEPGFSVWILLVDTENEKKAWSPGFSGTPTVQKILDITNPLLEGKLPEGFEKCCPGIESNPSIPRPTAQIVTIEDLVHSPRQYLDAFVEIQGFNAGLLERLECSPWFGAPTEWLLYSELPIYSNNVMVNNPLGIGVQNDFDGAITMEFNSCGYTIRNPYDKRVTLWGWVRLYDGPDGCGGYDENGTPIPMESKQVWYIEGVQLQFLENIDVTPPPGRQYCTPSAGLPTKTPPPLMP